MRLPTRFGPYELRSLIGEGETGKVYRADDTVKGRTVAVKLLRRQLAADPSFQERFRRECGMAARLREPHVVPVHDFGDIGGVLFIETRLIDGGSLKELLRAQGALEPTRAARITAQVAAALDAAHANGLIHGNVKPENVLLTRDDFAYLVDFGVAHPSSAYAAPERFSGGPVGPHVDVYSLACVLYECLTGQPPFECADPRETISAHMNMPPPRPSIMRRGIGRAFNDVIAGGMAKRPEARFSSAGELARVATEAASPGSAPSPAASPPTSTRPFTSAYPNPDDTGYSPYPPLPAPRVPARMPDLGRLRPVLMLATVVVLGVAALLAAISALGNHNSSPPETPMAAPPASSSTSPTKTPSLSSAVRGADGLGFVGHTARCDPGNPPAAVVRTARSLAVVCQSAPGSFYYRGERISDGANLEIANAVRSSGGFDATNPADGARYEVRPDRLRIISNGHVDSSEPVLQYATAV